MSTSSNSLSNPISDSLVNSSPSSNSIIPLGNSSSSSSSSSSSASSSSSSSIYSPTGLLGVSWYVWVIIIFVLALLGLNIFQYLAKGTQEVSDVFKPFVKGVLALFANISSTFVGIAAAGTKTIVGGTADVIDSGLTKIEDKAAAIQEKTSPSSLKSQSVEQNTDNTMDNNTLNTTLNRSQASQSSSGDYEADSAGSSIQAGSGKAGWCYIGEDRGFRSCMEIGKSDKCMSGDIFPSNEICVNPNLRP